MYTEKSRDESCRSSGEERHIEVSKGLRVHDAWVGSVLPPSGVVMRTGVHGSGLRERARIY